MKKLFIPVLLLFTIITLAGCSSKKEATQPQPTETVVEEVQQTSTPEEISTDIEEKINNNTENTQ